MNGHLVAVEIRVKGGANERVNFNGLSSHAHAFERLDTKPVKRWSAIQQYGVIFDDFFQDVPHNGILTFHHFLGGLHGGAMSTLFEPVIDEWLKQLERHLLRQAALMQMQLRPDDDDRASGIINTLPEQILPEPSLFSLQGIRERFQGSIVRTAENAAASSVVE